MARILIVEDEDNLRFSIAQKLKGDGHDVAESESVRGAEALLDEREFDLLLTDVNLVDGDGVQMIERVREGGFDGVVLVMTAYGTVQSAVEAMKQGADDYLQKPLSLEELSLLVERSLENRALRRKVDLYERLENAQAAPCGMIGESEAWREAVSVAERLATLPLPNGGGPEGETHGVPTILLTGETGVGKGVLARRIHDLQAEHRDEVTGDAPYVHVNCSALPGSLIESELFGHEKGAFTDAREARPGLFEMAEGGTIFLDEIGEMSMDLQAKMLLVLEEGVYRRVGGSRERRVRARIIAATNQDLDVCVQQGSFRRDLLYRLNAFTIELPRLADRGEDVQLLADALLTRFTREYRRGPLRFSRPARLAMARHDWPGNVRELLNVVQRAVMLVDGDEITPSDLGLSAMATPILSNRVQENGVAHDTRDLIFDFEDGVHTADEVERTLIIQALEHTRGNVSRAAKLIGMNRSSFRYRLQRSGLEDLAQEIARR